MKKITLIIAAIGLMAIGCTKDFEEINDNPNSPSKIGPEFLLTNVISEIADKNTYQQGFRGANHLAHFTSAIEFLVIDRYIMGTNSEYWNTIYSLQNDIQSIKTNENTNAAYNAVADIMSMYMYSQLTDMWGDIPFSEAIKAKQGNFKPKYDTQEFIYTDPQVGILATLKGAANTLSNISPSVQIKGDVMFKNDLNKWIKFANSLQIRYYLRISKRLNDFSELQRLANSTDIMQSNADNAVLPYLASSPNQNPTFSIAIGAYNEFRMSSTADSILTAWGDPRIAAVYNPSDKSVADGTPEYVGLQNGLSRETIAARGINLDSISLYGARFRDFPDGVDAQIMQYAELQFHLAEAAQKGFISGSAQQFYEEGIRASFEYYKLPLPSDYLTRPEISYGVDNLTKILTQKWFILNTNGHEAWFSIRRTGIPAIKAGPDATNGGMYPVRYLYPETEQATNGSNLAAAAGRMGGNDINSKGWWEKP